MILIVVSKLLWSYWFGCRMKQSVLVFVMLFAISWARFFKRYQSVPDVPRGTEIPQDQQPLKTGRYRISRLGGPSPEFAPKKTTVNCESCLSGWWFQTFLGKCSHLTNIFHNGLKPPSSCSSKIYTKHFKYFHPNDLGKDFRPHVSPLVHVWLNLPIASHNLPHPFETCGAMRFQCGKKIKWRHPIGGNRQQTTKKTQKTTRGKGNSIISGRNKTKDEIKSVNIYMESLLFDHDLEMRLKNSWASARGFEFDVVSYFVKGWYVKPCGGECYFS